MKYHKMQRSKFSLPVTATNAIYSTATECCMAKQQESCIKCECRILEKEIAMQLQP